MPRSDLLALTDDDLVALTNRGIVNRARRDLDANEVSCQLTEAADGELLFAWSDGFQCRLPAGSALHADQCSCPATTLCRHLVRAVLFYQRHHAAAPQQTATPTPAGPWDPGTIPDEELARHLKRQLPRLRQQFSEGLLVELHRGLKPIARFHHPPCVVRFPVPGDLHYTFCDCATAQPCGHVALAVWAFRRLVSSEKAGILSTSDQSPALPAGLLDRLEATLAEHAEQGVSGAAAGWKDRLARLEKECADADLVWPAEILSELIEQQDRYAQHDARFAPEEVAELAGELQARCQAIRHDRGALPQLLIRGCGGDRPGSLAKATFLGLGCGVQVRRRRVVLSAYAQDSDSGRVVAVVKEFPDPAGDPPPPLRSFHDLAQTTAVKGIAFQALGGGKLVASGSRPTARGQLKFGQKPVTLYPLFHDWEQVRPPVLVEDFNDLNDLLSVRPPSCLGSRRLGEDFFVCRVGRAEDVHFDAVTQTIQATLRDAQQQAALLVFPYTSRGQAGAETLLAKLAEVGDRLLFVSGLVRRGDGGLLIEPVGLLFSTKDGGRELLQPWIEAGRQTSVATTGAAAVPPTDPLHDCLRELRAAVEELLVLGLQRVDVQAAKRWRQLQQRAEAIGLVRLASPLRELADRLDARAHSLRWDARGAARLTLHLAMLLRLAV